MNVVGVIIDVLPVQSGEGKNGAWSKATYIVETSGQYPKKIAVCIWGEKLGVLSKGTKVDFSIDIESREFNGKWFTEVKAFKYELLSAGPESKPKAAPKGKATDKVEEDFSSFEPTEGLNDLPF